MLDFVTIATRTTKSGSIEVYPKFSVRKSKDLMIRGGDFYAIWVEDRGLWSTDEDDVIQLIDREIKAKLDELEKTGIYNAVPLYLEDSESRMIDRFHGYCQSQMRDNFKQLDEKLVFLNTDVSKKDYASKRLDYILEPGKIDAWDKLMSTLYAPEEREKIEWAIGAIVSGDSKHIQKFLVLYGSAGTGKSTVIGIIEKLFDGYYSVFDAKAMGSNSASFALESFKNNPLVALQHDGDLSKLEDNTRLNSVVSHEIMTMNEKFKSTYPMRFIAFLIMGTNSPVKITDAKSGLLRRLIDVTPTGNKVPRREYDSLMKMIDFELGAIASHCLDIYLDNPGRYNDYTPANMLGATNDFYNFIVDSYHIFEKENETTLTTSWEMYKTYCEDARVPYPLTKIKFKEELKNYFENYTERATLDDGTRIRNHYSGFLVDKFVNEFEEKPKIVVEEPAKKTWLEFETQKSRLDEEYGDCFAQYATDEGTPTYKWDNVKSTLSSLDTWLLHYTKLPINHIVIDFDLKDENGEKCFEKNLEAASKWPATYAELSKSGGGIHLHYIYTGDPTLLSRIYDDDIEVKVFTGNSSLRRRVTKCNNLPIATISSGLPLKEVNKLVNYEGIKNEKMLRTMIKRNLNKEYHGATAPSVQYIKALTDEAYAKGIGYDVSDMYDAIFEFCVNSTNQSDKCLKMLDQMKLKSDEPMETVLDIHGEKPIVFYDVEVFPNLFLINWKLQGKGMPVVRMINPKPKDVEGLLQYRLIGFNNRDYDNHMIYARIIGKTNEEIYNISNKLINGTKDEKRSYKFREAYNLSYTDVYDFAATKQSLKKWEIQLGIHHMELGLPWDKPVPEELWTKVAEYCDNDVIATEAVFDFLAGDWAARQLLVSMAQTMHPGIAACENNTTNELSAKIIFGTNSRPQSEFNWRDLSKPVGSDQYEEYRRKFGPDYIFRVFDADGMPLYRDYVPGEELPEGWSILPFFKGYKFEAGKSTYLGYEVGEGGRVYANPGIHRNVWDGDVTSQHPHSIIYECLFGVRYTNVFKDIVAGRVSVKRKDFDMAAALLNGALVPYLKDELVETLSYALKIVINSIYGLTSAKFMNIFRDVRNIDNIVAKRGNLFMTMLAAEVEKRGYTVAHIKTDSIKVPNADTYIIDFISKFGKEFGYNFETEAEFDRFCLVNDAVYVARFKEPKIDKKTGAEIWWTATGKQFQVPYVFKTLFSKEEVVFEDLCETFAVQAGSLYLDMNEDLPEGESDMQYIGRVGRFCPIKEGHGGGILYRVNEGKNFAATGSKGHRWLESELVYSFKDKRDNIDMSFYKKLVDDAVDTINKFGDFEQFVAETPVTETEPKIDLPWEVEAEMVYGTCAAS